MKEKSGLSPRAKEVFDHLEKKYEITGSRLMLVRIISTCWDHMLMAEDDIKKHGVTVQGDRTLKSNPATAVVKDTKHQIMAALKQLGLEEVTSKDPLLNLLNGK